VEQVDLMPDLSRKRERERLAVRDAPYYQRLCSGGYLSFRRGPNTWGARYRDRRGGQNRTPFPDLSNEDYDGALRCAFEWIAQLSKTAVRSAKRTTVQAALETYLADLRRHGRQDAAKGAEWRFKKYVYKDRLATIDLEKLTRDDMEEWRQRHVSGRAARTVERQLRSVRAGLNRALELGHVGNAAAWSLKALRDEIEDSGDTAVMLSPAQRSALIAAGAEIGPFLRGIELTGARPGELANAKVGDFDGESLRLAHRKGKPPKLRARLVVLSAEGIEHFKAHGVNRPATAPIFTEASGIAWRRHMWARRIREVIANHNIAHEKNTHPSGAIPVSASAYSFRHARISELLQIHSVDPLTVAQQTGTSVAMIERAYFKFLPNAMRHKLASIVG
jgi:integrase